MDQLQTPKAFLQQQDVNNKNNNSTADENGVQSVIENQSLEINTDMSPTEKRKCTSSVYFQTYRAPQIVYKVDDKFKDDLSLWLQKPLIDSRFTDAERAMRLDLVNQMVFQLNQYGRINGRSSHYQMVRKYPNCHEIYEDARMKNPHENGWDASEFEVAEWNRLVAKKIINPDPSAAPVKLQKSPTDDFEDSVTESLVRRRSKRAKVDANQTNQCRLDDLTDLTDLTESPVRRRSKRPKGDAEQTSFMNEFKGVIKMMSETVVLKKKSLELKDHVSKESVEGFRTELDGFKNRLDLMNEEIISLKAYKSGAQEAFAMFKQMHEAQPKQKQHYHTKHYQSNKRYSEDDQEEQQLCEIDNRQRYIFPRNR